MDTNKGTTATSDIAANSSGEFEDDNFCLLAVNTKKKS